MKNQKYMKPTCEYRSMQIASSMLAASPNKFDDNQGGVSTGGESGRGDAGGAHSKSWGSVWEDDKD